MKRKRKKEKRMDLEKSLYLLRKSLMLYYIYEPAANPDFRIFVSRYQCALGHGKTKGAAHGKTFAVIWNSVKRSEILSYMM